MTCAKQHNGYTGHLSDFHTSSSTERETCARTVFENYIKSGSPFEMSEITRAQREHIKKQLALGGVALERSLFDDVRRTVHNYLARGINEFFHSDRYFTWLVTAVACERCMFLTTQDDRILKQGNITSNTALLRPHTHTTVRGSGLSTVKPLKALTTRT